MKISINRLPFTINHLLLLVITGLFLACSSSKKTKTQQHRPMVVLNELQQLDYDYNFIEATKLKMFGNLPAAASILTRCVDINPYDAAAHYQLAEIYTAVDDLRNALRYARLSVKYAPENEWYMLQLANIYLMDKKLDSAIIVYRQIVEKKPENVDMRFNMAFLYLENNEYRKAIKEVDKIEKIYGFTENIAVARYKAYSKKGDKKATEAVLKKAIKEYPDEFRFYGLLAEMYSSIGREKEADEYYTKLLKVDPENVLGLISMLEFYKDYGKDAKVLEEMERIFEMKTIDIDLKIDLYLHISADIDFFKKHYKQMDALIELLYEKYTDNIRVRIINTDLNLRLQNFEEAKDDLLFITDRIQTNYFLWEQLFYILNLLEEYETLFETSTKALIYFDDRYLFHFSMDFRLRCLKSIAMQ